MIRKKINRAMMECSITITHDVMNMAAQLNLIEDLGENPRKTNKYIGIVGTNSCLIGVAQNNILGNYCIINKSIEIDDDKSVDLVDKLKKFSFHGASNGKSRIKIRSGRNELTKRLGYEKSAINIEEIIHTISTSKITGKKTGLEIHHKSYVFDHRVECCEQITKIAHKTKGNKSHKEGFYALNLVQFMALLVKLEADKNYFKTI